MVRKIEITLDSPGYHAGSVVTGNLTVKVDTPKKYKLIKVVLIGKADVHWEEHYSDENKIYRNNENFLQLSCVVWQKGDSPDGELPSGDHIFPFQISLPLNIPSALESRIGRIRYTVHGKIQTSALKSDHTTNSVYVTVNKPPLNVQDVTLLTPLHYQKEKNAKLLFGASQPLKFSFNLSRTVYSRGEAVPLAVSISNESSKSVKMVVTIVQTEVYRAHRGKENSSSSKVVRVQSDQIEARSSKTWRANLSIPLNVMSTYDNAYCKCITVYFTLKVKMKVPWATNMNISVPITVRDSYIQNQAPESLPFAGSIPPHTPQFVGQGIRNMYPGQQTAGTQPQHFGSPQGPVVQQLYMYGVPPLHSQIIGQHPMHQQPFQPSLLPQQQLGSPSTYSQQFGMPPLAGHVHPSQMGSGPADIQQPYRFGVPLQPIEQFGVQVPPSHATQDVLPVHGILPSQQQPPHPYPYSSSSPSAAPPSAHYTKVGLEHTQQRTPTTSLRQLGMTQPLNTQPQQQRTKAVSLHTQPSYEGVQPMYSSETSEQTFTAPPSYIEAIGQDHV